MASLITMADSQPQVDSMQAADHESDTILTSGEAQAKSTPSPAADALDAGLPTELDEQATIDNLNATVRDQDDMERDIGHQAELAIIEAEDKKDQKRIEKEEARRLKLSNEKRAQEQKLRNSGNNPAIRLRLQKDIARIDAEIAIADNDIADFGARIAQRHKDGAEEVEQDQGGNRRLATETQREFLIRTGKITPFAKFGGPRPDGVQGELADAVVEAEDEAVADELEDQATSDQPRSHQNLRMPGFAEEPDVPVAAAQAEFSLRPRKRQRVAEEAVSSPTQSLVQDSDNDTDITAPGSSAKKRRILQRGGDDSFIDDDPSATEEAESEDYDMTDFSRATKPKKRSRLSREDSNVDLSRVDDGDEAVYQSRLADWVERRSRARRRKQEADGVAEDENGNDEEWFKPSPDQPDHHFENGLKLPGDIYPSLFDYQKTGVQWLGELYTQKVGGIVGDEMGLGKTIQLIAFVTALHYSKKLTKPVIVVAPATVLQQWVSEFHRWWPPLRVSILHSSGSGMLNLEDEGRIEDAEYSWEKKARQPSKSSKAAKKIVDRVVDHGHVLVTTYAGLQTYGDALIPVDWDYAVLDEGHKIRNPNTAITIYCKELRTTNRVILSGTPMQNNLTELWSLFDFIYPMRLGTLVNFRNQFEVPIKLGQYANATNLQIMTGQKCAETLRDTIAPYLLQRVKKDVAADLPKKSEQVLFCKLTRPQREAYEIFLKSEDMNAILNKNRQGIYGIDILRKICNHPDLLDPRLRTRPGYNWGAANKSGKMQVVKSLLQIWKRMGHKTLFFCQGVQMLDIMEAFVRRQQDIKFLRMDGKTSIKDRQMLVDQFNNTPDIHLFLLTTRVGGLGVNLTGANRVIIFDPDWNPSTDVQARERAWRLGQKKEVTIYRLMTAGTIEEKIYQRQIFKQFLANKVLKDPKQRTTLNLSDLHDLFTLGSDEDGATETSLLFKTNDDAAKTVLKPRLAPGNGAANYMLDDEHARLARNAADMGSNIGDDNNNKQVTQISGLSSIAEYQQPEDTAHPEGDEDRIMAGIFARAGIHETLEHDDIVNGKKTVKADRAILQREADRVAAQAANHLRRAGEEAQHVPIGTVTWTGEYGEAGRPTNIRRGRGGPSSASVLAGIADRQGLGGANGRGNGSGSGVGASTATSRASTPVQATGYKARDFEKMIPAFIRRQGGQVASKMLIDHFNQYCGDKKSSAEFKVALDTVAKMEKKGASLRGIWALKPAFR